MKKDFLKEIHKFQEEKKLGLTRRKNFTNDILCHLIGVIDIKGRINKKDFCRAIESTKKYYK